MGYITRLVLGSLGVFGYVGLHVFAASNGLFELIPAAIENGVHAHKFTGLQGVDDLFNFFVAFFWPCVDGNHPGISLLSIVFAGQMFAGWALIIMEGYRPGNAGRAIS
jgi:hypothetical protein